MAAYNEILTGRFNRGFQKFFSMKGGASVIQLGGEILPVVGIYQDAGERYLQDVRSFGAVASVAPGVGNTGSVTIINPPGSTIIAVINKILLVSVTAGTFNFFIGKQTGALPVTTANIAALDSRGNPVSNCIYSSPVNPSTAGFTLFDAYSMPASGQFDAIIDQPQAIMLLPGDQLQIVGAATALSVQASMRWTERFLEESERK